MTAAGSCGGTQRGWGLRGRAGVGAGRPRGPPGQRAVLKGAAKAAVQAEAVACAATLNGAEEHVVYGAYGALQLQQARVLRWAGAPRQVANGRQHQRPAVHGYCGQQGALVAPAQQGKGSSSFLRPCLWRATPSPVLSQRRQLSPGFQEATTLAGPHAINSALSPPSLLSQAASLCPPSPLPAHHLQWRPLARRCRSHHEAEDQTEWPAEDTKVKGPALHTDMATPTCRTELWRPRFLSSFVPLYKSLMWALVSISVK